MRVILTAALAVLLACPAFALVQSMPFRAVCASDLSEVEDNYGPLVELDSRVSDRGFGLLLAGNTEHEVAMIVTPDGLYCVLWDNNLAQGDPA